jgi:hypothetical protein
LRPLIAKIGMGTSNVGCVSRRSASIGTEGHH